MNKLGIWLRQIEGLKIDLVELGNDQLSIGLCEIENPN